MAQSYNCPNCSIPLKKNDGHFACYNLDCDFTGIVESNLASLINKQPNKVCIRCGSDNSSCSFHSGEASIAFSTGADARSPDMAYRDVYTWSCCGKHEPSEVIDGIERPPSRKSGCCEAAAHLFQAKVTFVTGSDVFGLFEGSNATFVRAGIDVDFISLDKFVPESGLWAESAAVCFLLGQEFHEEAMRKSEALREGNPSIPIVIFSDPDHVNGWRIQALSSHGMTPEILSNAVHRAIRWGARPNLLWSPLIFLSYSRVDASVMQSWVDRLNRMERPCWVDKQMLAPGVDWSDEIETGIRSSENFVMILTKNTPRPTYCWKELEIARAAGKPLIIVAFDGQSERFLSIKAERKRNWQKFDVFYDNMGVSQKIPAQVEVINGAIVAVVLELEEGPKESAFGSHYRELDRYLGAADWVRFWLQKGFDSLQLQSPSKRSSLGRLKNWLRR